MWFRLAARLGMSLQRCQQETTSTEFMEWQAFLDMEPNMFNATHDYLAQIAAEVHRTRVRTPRNVKLEDKRLKFTRGKSAPTKRGKRGAVATSKAAWGAALGIDL